MTNYDAAFFDSTTDVGLTSAPIILPRVLEDTGARSVIDIGCARGAWLSIAQEHGCRVHGVDQYDPSGGLLIERDEYTQADLSKGFDCSGFQLAMCLEVGEHLPHDSARALVAGLCKATWVLWSAAIPGQGGNNHVNEAWPSYWVPLFAEHGYVGTTKLRERHWNDKRIAPWFHHCLLWSKPALLWQAGFVPGVTDVRHPDCPGSDPCPSRTGS